MPHLISSLSGSLHECHAALGERHGELVTAARRTLDRFADLESGSFGAAAKRVTVAGAGDQPLGEVLNQCATIERLLDAMAWSKSEFPDAVVQVCHPTTSSRKGRTNELDADLLLVSSQGLLIAAFEVSDVASSTRDGNRKESRDLGSLGVASGWSGTRHRVFLAVSQEFADMLERKSKHRSRASWTWTYVRHRYATTSIMEVVPKTKIERALRVSPPRDAGPRAPRKSRR